MTTRRVTSTGDKFVRCLSEVGRSLDRMRTRDDIDAELKLPVAVRASIREQGGEPSSNQIDELLDARGMASGG